MSAYPERLIPIIVARGEYRRHFSSATFDSYDIDTLEQVAQLLFNTLCRHHRDALIAFLLVQKSLQDWGVVDADSLFEFFLIDVQIGLCLQTSQIKQAISSV
jgi:hypothetical protein